MFSELKKKLSLFERSICMVSALLRSVCLLTLLDKCKNFLFHFIICFSFYQQLPNLVMPALLVNLNASPTPSVYQKPFSATTIMTVWIVVMNMHVVSVHKHFFPHPPPSPSHICSITPTTRKNVKQKLLLIPLFHPSFL